jgi:uncharacterized membrane protein
MLIQLLLTLATLLCSLVAGFLFAFATVVMPGIGKLDDAGFLRAFQVIDGVIQKMQPVFVLVWLGSVLALVAATVIGAWTLPGCSDRLILITAALVYLLGVQAPTFVVNVPLNNALQRLELETMDAMGRRRARDDFEPRWNRWNLFRTAAAVLVSVLLMVLLLRT